MAIKLIRRDGGTVTAYEDMVAFSFAFPRDGVIAGVASELHYNDLTPNTFGIDSGMGVIQGRQFQLEAKEDIPIMQATGATQYYYIAFAEMDMSAIENEEQALFKGKVTIKTDYYQNYYPSFPESDNLNSVPLGKAYLPLYRFKQTSTGIQDIQKVFNLVSAGEVNDLPQSDESFRVANTRYVKQAIEDVKNITESSILLSAGFTAAQNYLKRQINFVYGSLSFYKDTNTVANGDIIGVIPVGFRPKHDIQVGIIPTVQMTIISPFVGGSGELVTATVKASTGQIVIAGGTQTAGNNIIAILSCRIFLGYEITGEVN